MKNGRKAKVEFPNLVNGKKYHFDVKAKFNSIIPFENSKFEHDFKSTVKASPLFLSYYVKSNRSNEVEVVYNIYENGSNIKNISIMLENQIIATNLNKYGIKKIGNLPSGVRNLELVIDYDGGRVKKDLIVDIKDPSDFDPYAHLFVKDLYTTSFNYEVYFENISIY